MLFIHDDHAHVAQRRRDRQPRADHHVSGACPDPAPLVGPLPVREPRVHQGDGDVQVRPEPIHERERKGDLRNQYQPGPSRRDGRRDRLHVDGRLATTGDAVQEQRLGITPLDRTAKAEPQADARGVDEKDVESAIARLQAQIDRQISDYNKRPKRLTFGINAVGVSYARYVDAWATKIERIGTERYPQAARGRLYDSMIITVEVDRHGNVVDVILNRKSRHEILNRAVREIVLAGAPYERFPPEMAREGDILQIVRTWNFTNDSLATQSVDRP